MELIFKSQCFLYLIGELADSKDCFGSIIVNFCSKPKNIHQQEFFPPEIAEMEQARAFFDQGVTVARGWGHSIDLWVAKNVSKQNQTYLMFGLIVCMVLHLVYTKRKVQREVKEEQMLAKQNKKKN